MNRFTELVLALGTATLGLFAVAEVLALGWMHAPSHHCALYSKSRADVMAIAGALYEYALQNDMRYPGSLAELVQPDTHGITCLRLHTVPRDQLGREYGYAPPVGDGRPRIFTLGRDGAPGGEGEDADLDSDSLLASLSTAA